MKDNDTEKIALFDPKTERYTQRALEISIEVSRILAPLFDKYQKQNVSMRDLKYVIDTEVADLALNMVLFD
jgi:hypothetical protein